MNYLEKKGYLKIAKLVLFFIFCLVFAAKPVKAADRYWVGGSDGANTNDTANWSSSSGNACGVSGGASVPVSTDVAIFNSDCTNGATIDANLDVLGIDINTGYSGTITQASSITIDVGASHWVQDAGIFVGGNSAITIEGGNFTLNSGGNFTSTSDNFSIERNFTINSGATFAHGSGTIIFDGDHFLDDGALACGSKTFNSVTINKTDGGAILTIGSDCTLPLGNDATITGPVITNNGSLTIGTGTLTVAADLVQSSAGASITFTGTTIDVNHDSSSLAGSLTLTAGSFTAGSMTTLNSNGAVNNSADLLPTGLTLNLDGDTGFDDTVLTCSGNEAFSLVTISKNNNGAIVTVGADCVLPLGNSPSTTFGGLTNNGTINAGTGTWTIGGNFTQSDAAASTTFSGTTIDVNPVGSTNGDFVLTAGSFTAASLTTLSVDSNLNNSANLLPNGLDLTLDGGATWADCNLNCGTTTFGSITINKGSGSNTVPVSNCTTSGNFTITDGQLDNPGSAYTLTVQGDFSLNGTDDVGGANWTVKLTGGNSQNITQHGSNAFKSPFQIDKNEGTTATLTSAFSNNSGSDNCDIVEGILDLDGYAFTCGGTFTVQDGSTLQLEGDESITSPTVSSGSTVIYNGNGDTNPDSYALLDLTYHHLTINNTDSNDTTTANALTDVDIGGAFTITQGIFIAPTGDLTVTGNWSNSGTFTHNSGDVILNGVGQSLTGNTTFDDFTKATAATDVLTFAASSRQTFEGTMTLTGQDSNLLSLRSSSPSTAWEIDPQSTRTIQYLDVQDSNNVNATAITTSGLNITNSDRNTNWTFNSAPTATAPTSISQATDGGGYITFSTTISDADNNDTKLKVEYSDDGGSSWYDPDLVSTTPSSGSVDLDDAQTYQIGTVNAIDTSGGAVTLTTVWDTKSTNNENGTLDNTSQSDIQLRVTPNDATIDGSVATSSSFSVDNQDPAAGTISIDNGATSTTSTSVTLTISASSVSQMIVSENSSFTGASWEAYAISKSFTLSSSTGTKTVYLKAQDDLGNQSSTSSDTITLNANNPSDFTLDSPGSGSFTNSARPTFKWKAAYPADTDLSKYQLEIDNGGEGNFDLDNIPNDRSTDYETQKYYAKYEGFSDSDNNNYISLHTRSSGSWNQSQNNGELREGKRVWGIKAVNTSGNVREESADLYVDFTPPALSVFVDNTQIDNNQTLKTTTSSPTISGTITDNKKGSYDDGRDKIRSDPQKIVITVTKIGSWIDTLLETILISDLSDYTSQCSDGRIPSSADDGCSASFSYQLNDLSLENNYQVKVKAYDWAGNTQITTFALSPTGLSTKTKEEVEKQIKEIEEEKEVSLTEEQKEEIIKDVGKEHPQITPSKPTRITKNVLNHFLEALNMARKSLASNLPKPKVSVPNLTENFLTRPIIKLRKGVVVAYQSFVAVVFDKEPTKIIGVQVGEIKNNQATVTFVTNHPSTVKINYGLSTEYGQEKFLDQKSIGHTVILDNLEPETKYFFEIIANGKNTAIDAYRTFETLAE